MVIKSEIIISMVDNAVESVNTYKKNCKEDIILFLTKSKAVDGRYMYLKKLQEQMSNTRIVSVLPADVIPDIKRQYQLDCIGEPAEFARSFFAFDQFEVDEDIKSYINDSEFYDEFIHLKEYASIDDNGAYLLTYFAVNYIRKMLLTINPKTVIMWNEFYGIHCIVKKICDDLGFNSMFFEFGVLPGSYAFDYDGQMGESFPAVEWEKFQKLQVSSTEIEDAASVREQLMVSGLNRKAQPKTNALARLRTMIDPNKPIVLYAGQNDLDAGMIPYTDKTKKYHSPMFETSFDTACALANIAKRKGWNLIYKPHPSRIVAESKDFPDNLIYVSDININEIIDVSDLVITTLSQTAYVSMIRKTPVLMLGFNQIINKGCVYQAHKVDDIEKQIELGLSEGLTEEQNRMFIEHMARLRAYYLYDDLSQKPFECGKSVSECAQNIALISKKLPSCDWTDWKASDKFVIWGGGTLASKYIKAYYQKSNFVAIIDNDCKNKDSFSYGVPVVGPEYLKEHKEVRIIIGCGAWIEISQQLIEMGYSPYKDFIPYWIYELESEAVYGKTRITDEQLDFIRRRKKIIAFMGNCQMGRYYELLKADKEFFRDYYLLKLPLIQNLSKWQCAVGPRANIMSRIDVYVCQPISDSNKFSPLWSNSAVKKLLNPECRIITIPNLYFKGYFPQSGHDKLYYKGVVNVSESAYYNKINKNSINEIKRNNHAFPWGDKFIESMCERRIGIESMIEQLSAENYLDEATVVDNYKSSIEELEARERESCDIFISDFIKENYQKYRLFYAERHPTYIVINELIKRLYAALGRSNYNISYYPSFENDMEFAQNVLPIYPSVAKHLNLKFKNEFFYVGRPYCEYPITLDEYIKLYAKTIYSDTYVEDTMVYYLDSIICECNRDNYKLYFIGDGDKESHFINSYPVLKDYIVGYININNMDEIENLSKGGIALLIIDSRNEGAINKYKDMTNIRVYRIYNR